MKKAPKKPKPRVIVPERKIIAPSPLLDFSKPVNLSCKDWEKRIIHGQSIMPDGVLPMLQTENAVKARMLFGKLRLPDVPEQPLIGDVSAEWIFEFVSAVFGSWNGFERAINEFFLLVPKKNSKTTYSAGIMVTAMLRSERPRAEFLLIAPTQLIANLAFQQAVGMCETHPEIARIVHIQESHKKIINRLTKCSLQIKSFDPKVLTGVKPAGVLLDEVHVIAEHSNADRVLGQIRGGLISQPEGFLIQITTQSERVPSGVFRSELLKARKVRDGSLKIKMLPLLYEFPEKMVKQEQWRDTANWHMVTPNMDRSITLKRLEEDYHSAVASGEEELRRWASQHLNIEIGMALRSDHWVGAKFWQQTAAPLQLDQLIEQSEVITVGIDGGGLDDMLALSVCGRHKDDGHWMTWCRAWLHKIALDRRKQDIPIYKDFEREGDLVIVDNFGEDVCELGEIVEVVLKSGKFDKVGIDPSAIGGIIDELSARGVDTETQIVGVSQGWRLTSAIKTLERKLAEGTYKHAIQGLTRWSAENARVEPKGNAILITKQASGNAKIDPLMATFNAIDLMSRNPGGEKKYQMMFV